MKGFDLASEGGVVAIGAKDKEADSEGDAQGDKAMRIALAR